MNPVVTVLHSTSERQDLVRKQFAIQARAYAGTARLLAKKRSR